ncbi:MAG: sortase [Candidatus Dojkabacteria bacterium]
MESSGNRGTTIILFVVIGALIIGLVGIGSVIYTLLTSNQPFSTGSTSVQASSGEQNTVTPDVEPISTPIERDFDYNFAIKDRNTYNSDNVFAVAASKSDTDSPSVAGISFPTPKAKEGVRDVILTKKVINHTNAVVKAGKKKIKASSIRRISIPSVNINSPIVQGQNGDAALDQGMWLYPSQYAKGEKILLCHRRYFGTNDPRSCWFIDRANRGDIIKIIDKNGKVAKYKIKSQSVRKGNDLSIFKASSDDIIKIITCTPLGSSSHRLVTIAKRV